MSLLRVTLIDVGWGDSIFLESQDAQGNWHFALIDSNDTTRLRSSYIFLQRFFERRAHEAGELFQRPPAEPTFEWVLLTHAHADHGRGLKGILRDFGAEQFWYPKSRSKAGFFTGLLRFVRRSERVQHHQAIDDTKVLLPFGDATLEVLWPPHNHLPENENNNSVVLLLRLGQQSFLLTGDAEAEVWEHLAGQIPPDIAFFKVPHHGSDDSVFSASGKTHWLDALQAQRPDCPTAITSHVRPFSHPSPETITELENRNQPFLRTDRNFHITVETDGTETRLIYSHLEAVAP